MTAQELETMYENKRRFVEKLSEALIMIERFGLSEIVYSRRDNHEIIEITFKDGFRRNLDVTGDSEYAIILDIHRTLG